MYEKEQEHTGTYPLCSCSEELEHRGYVPVCSQEEIPAQEEIPTQEEQPENPPAQPDPPPAQPDPPPAQPPDGMPDDSMSDGIQLPISFLSANAVSVSNWTEFRLAVANASVDGINLTGDIIRPAYVLADNLVTITRSLTINGNGYTINFGSGTVAATSIVLGSAPAGTVLRLENVQLVKAAGNSIIQSTAANSSNWKIELENVVVPSASQRGLVDAQNASVTVGGTANSMTLFVIGQNHFNIANLTMLAGSKMYVQAGLNASGGSVTSNTAIAMNNNGVIVLEDFAELTVVNKGTTITDSTAGSHAIYGNFTKLIIGKESKLIIDTTQKAIHCTGTSTPLDIELKEKSELVIDANDGITTRTSTLNRITTQTVTLEKDSKLTINAGTTGLSSYANLFVMNMVDGAYFYSKAWRNSGSTGTIGNCLGLMQPSAANNSTTNIIVNISGAGTELHVETNSTDTADGAGAICVEGNGAIFNVTDGAKITGYSTAATVMQFQSFGSVFTVKDGGEILLEQAGDNGYARGSVIRFRLRGNQTFNVDNAKITVIKESGGAPGIRLYGGNNAINVTNGGEFRVYNAGSGTPNNGNTNAGNQGIYYTDAGAATNDGFVLSGKGSIVEVIADSGPAICADSTNSGSFTVTAGPDTIFILHGRTSTSNAGALGTFSTTCPLFFTLDNPLYFDIRNNCTAALSGGYTGAPAVHSAATTTQGDQSFFSLVNSDLSVWRRATAAGTWVNMDGSPTRAWTLFNCLTRGMNLQYITYTDIPKHFYNNSTGLRVNPTLNNPALCSYLGIEWYSRLSANNAKPIIDELRVPTNADKYLHGHASVPEGLMGIRDAWTDEVYVTVRVKDAQGNIVPIKDMHGNYVNEAEWVTSGMDQANPAGVKVYNDPFRGGIFKIPYEPDPADPRQNVEGNGFLPTGYTFEVLSAYRSSMGSKTQQYLELEAAGIFPGNPLYIARVHESDYTDDIQAVLLENQGSFFVTVVDKTPPVPASIDVGAGSQVELDDDGNYIISTMGYMISGTSIEAAGVTVSLSLNGEIIKENGTPVTATVGGDGTWSLQIPGAFYTLKEGDVIQVFLTDSAGNINPVKDTEFHDALFSTNDFFMQGTIIYVGMVAQTDVTVSKEVTGQFSDKNISWEFTAYFTDKALVPLHEYEEIAFEGGIISGGVSPPVNGKLILDGEGKAVFSLKHGQKITFKVQPDFFVRIVETPDTSYDTTFLDTGGPAGDNDTGLTTVGLFEDHGRIFSFYNERKSADLTVSKLVKGAFNDKSKEWPFRITLLENDGSDTPLSGSLDFTGGTISVPGAAPPQDDILVFDENGEATFSLLHGQKITINKVPVNTKIKIEELPAGDYTASYTDSNYPGVTETDSVAEILLAETDPRFIDYTNTRNPTPELGIKANNRAINMLFVFSIFSLAILVYIQIELSLRRRWQ